MMVVVVVAVAVIMIMAFKGKQGTVLIQLQDQEAK